MKQWRPKDWDSNEMHLDMLRANIDDMDGEAFIEAGADAMLRALKKRGNYFTIGEGGKNLSPEDMKLREGDKGWMVFIPKEGNDD